MITLVDSQSWAAADLTGNSALVTVGAAMFLVGGRRDTGHPIFKTTDYGATWTEVGLIPTAVGSLDPAVVLSRDGVTLQIVLAVPNTQDPILTDIVKYGFHTGTNTLSAVLPLVVGSRAATGYDVTPLATPQGGDAGTLVVAAAQEPTTPAGLGGKYALLAVEVATDNTLTYTTLEQSPWASGATCGGISLLSPISANIELFYTSHPRSFTFKDTVVEIKRRIRTAANTWDVAQTLTTYAGRFTDDKLTAIVTVDNGRALAQAYHRWVKGRGQQTNIIFGVATADAGGTSWTWAWGNITADDYNSVKEPVIETDGTGVTLAYLNCPWLTDTKTYARAGFLRVLTIGSNLEQIQRPGAWQGLRFKWLRGSKGFLDATSHWAVVGIGGNDTSESGSGPALYLSQYNLAPHAVLAPSTLTVKRGVVSLLDASGTLDPDLDSLTYAWTMTTSDPHVHLTPIEDGKKALLLVDRTIGPAEVQFQVTVTVDDGQVGHQVSASSLVTVPFNAAPTITVPTLTQVTRNSRKTVSATVADADLDALTYTWAQVSGTTIYLEDADTPTVTAWVYQAVADGEDIVLRLTVEDGVNPPVTADTTLRVSAILARDRDAGVMARAYYQVAAADAKISQRNASTGVWAAAQELTDLSDFFQVRIVNVSSGDERFCYTSPKSLLVMTQQARFLVRYPPTGERIKDSAHDELDQSYLLTDQGRVLRYTSAGPGGISDWPDEVIPISDLVSGTYWGILVEPANSGRRVITLYGTSGVLMLQVMEDTFSVVDTYRLDMDSGVLPSNRVQFIRTNSVVGLKGGQILVGVIDNSGSTVEVLVDLAQRRAVGTWDRSILLSKTVTTGEILQTATDITQGRPAAPEWEEPELVGQGLYTLLWTQRRPDLVISYEIWLGLDAAQPILYTSIPSGSIRRTTLPTTPGHTYHLTIRAQGASAWSAFSAEHLITT